MPSLCLLGVGIACIMLMPGMAGASEEGDPGILSVSWQLKFCICFTGFAAEVF